jgi:hypothetical protein
VPFVVGAAAWLVVQFLGQHAAPYPRIWTFLIPIGAAMSGAGLCWLLGLVVKASRPREIAGMLASVAALVVLSIPVLRDRSACNLTEGQDLPDAPAIAAYVSSHDPGDGMVLAMYPGYPVLRYYFRRQGLPPALLVRSERHRYTLLVLDVPLEVFNREAEVAKPITDDMIEPVRSSPRPRSTASNALRAVNRPAR